ncbi:MAG TPA: hypothetical protein VGQ18_00815 [Gemmatimonadales bacterium]|jgi:hypothetical protein|nr:hypothetical protein [Gemmatimonadales bacterium]
MAERVRDFLRAHQTDGVGQGLGLAKLEELLQRAQVLAGQQRVGVAMTRQATKQREEVRRALQGKILRYVRVVGKVAAKQKGELANQFPLPPGNASQQALLTAARATLEKATAEKDVLVTLGMSPQVLEDLSAALAGFDQTLEATRAGPKGLPWALRALGRRREHVGASAELEAICSEIAEQVRLLDGVVQYRFGDDAELMGAWHSARNVAGPVKTKGGGATTPKAA